LIAKIKTKDTSVNCIAKCEVAGEVSNIFTK